MGGGAFGEAGGEVIACKTISLVIGFSLISVPRGLGSILGAEDTRWNEQ